MFDFLNTEVCDEQQHDRNSSDRIDYGDQLSGKCFRTELTIADRAYHLVNRSKIRKISNCLANSALQKPGESLKSHRDGVQKRITQVPFICCVARVAIHFNLLYDFVFEYSKYLFGILNEIVFRQAPGAQLKQTVDGFISEQKQMISSLFSFFQ